MNVDFLYLLGSGFIPGWFAVAIIVVRWLRDRPANKLADNEARRLEIEADGGLRSDLLKRIRDLEEAQHNDRLQFLDAMRDERKRCDDELDAIRHRLSAAEDDNRGLQAMIRQNSQSTAQMIGDPGGAAVSKAARKRRESE